MDKEAQDLAEFPGHSKLLSNCINRACKKDGAPYIECSRLTKLVIGVTIDDRRSRPMNVSLTPELEQFIDVKVGSGRYNSASEVVREALRLLEEHDQARSAQIAAFNRELGSRLASLDRGERVDPSAARQRIEGKSRARRKAGA